MGRKNTISVISSRMGRYNLSKICVSTHMLSLWENFRQFLSENNLVFVKKLSMLTKDKIKKSIDLLPDGATIDELINSLILLDKIEQGLDDIEKGNVYTTEEVEENLSSWLK